jgi:hypothetical protein
MVHRWDLAEVKKEMACACLCMGSMRDQILCKIVPFLATSPRPYMGDEVSRSGPSRLQVFANPN